MPASERTGVAPASWPARCQQATHRRRRRPPPRRHLTDARPPRPRRDDRPEHRRDRVRERRARRRRRHRIHPDIHQQHREPRPQRLSPPTEHTYPAPHRLHRPAQPGRDRANSCSGGLRSQRRSDHLHQISSAQQREHRRKHMRRPTRRTPRAPRTHHHRPGRTAQRADSSPPPRTQRTTTSRAQQGARHQPRLDLDRVRPYREHSASVRYTALPGRLANRDHREGLRMPSIGKAPPQTNVTTRPARAKIRRAHNAASTPLR